MIESLYSCGCVRKSEDRYCSAHGRHILLKAEAGGTDKRLVYNEVREAHLLTASMHDALFKFKANGFDLVVCDSFPTKDKFVSLFRKFLKQKCSPKCIVLIKTPSPAYVIEALDSKQFRYIGTTPRHLHVDTPKGLRTYDLSPIVQFNRTERKLFFRTTLDSISNLSYRQIVSAVNPRRVFHFDAHMDDMADACRNCGCEVVVHTRHAATFRMLARPEIRNKHKENGIV